MMTWSISVPAKLITFKQSTCVILKIISCQLHNSARIDIVETGLLVKFTVNIHLYDLSDLVNNRIGSKGCKYLTCAEIKGLTRIHLGTISPSKETTKLLVKE